MNSYDRYQSTRAGTVGATVILAAVVAVSNYDDLVFLDADHEITAIFADAGGIDVGDKVELVGVNVGQVTDIALRGTDVKVTMSVRENLALGEQPRAHMRTRAVLGAKAIVLVPSEDPGRYDSAVPIPLERTRAPYDLPTELGALTANVADIDTDQLSDALRATSEVLAQSAPEVHTALDGVARLSDTLGSRDEALKDLLRHGSTVSGVLAERRSQLNALVLDGNTLFAAVDARRAALHTLTTHLSEVARQISGLIADNRVQLGPALERVNRVLDLLERHRSSLEASIPGLATYARTLNEALGSGPFFQAYITNLLPGQFVQPFIDAALGDGRVPTPPAETPTEGPR